MPGIDAFDAKYGTTTTYAKANTAWNSGVAKQPAAPSSPTDFFRNAANSLKTIPGDIAHAVINPIVKGFRDVSGGISEAITGGQTQAANDAYQRSIQDASMRYSKLYSEGKLSKKAYTKLSNELNAQSQSLNNDISQQVSEMVTPKDFAMGLATVGSLPLAGGRLAGVAAGSKLATAARVLGSPAATDAKVGVMDSTIGSTLKAAAKGVVKYPLVTQPVATAPIQLASDIKSGDTGKAVTDAALLASPALLAGAGKIAKAVAPVIHDAAYGKIMSNLADTFGAKKTNEWLKNATPVQMNELKSVDIFTGRQRSVAGATKGEHFADYLKAQGVDPKKATLEDVVAHHQVYRKQVEALDAHKVATETKINETLAKNKAGEATAKAANKEALAKYNTEVKAAKADATNPLMTMGKDGAVEAPKTTPEKPVPVQHTPTKVPTAVPENAAVSADFTKALPAGVKVLQELPETATKGEKAAAVSRALDEMGVKNPTVRNQIGAALTEVGTGSEMAAALKPIVQRNIIKLPKGVLDEGFIATYGPNEMAKLPSLAEAAAAPDIAMSGEANPFVSKIAGALDKAGIGLKDYNTAQIGKARETFVKGFDDLGIEGRDGKTAYEDLSQLAEQHHLSDLRQLKVGEITQKLDVSAADARKIMAQAKDMYSGLSFSERGIAGKVQDFNQKFNPLAPGYARIQGKLRYDLNPAFRAQQRIEAATLGQVATGGHSPVGDVSKTIELMRKSEFIPGGGQGYSAQAMNDIEGGTKITTQLTASEERSLARVLQATATKNGVKVEDELKNEDTRRLMRAIVMNPKQGILSSNFAKAANLLFFPSAYNVKVSGIALKALASQPPAVQFGVMKGINDFHDWSKTDEGIKWQSKNSEVLGLLNYFTPINSIEQIYKTFEQKDIHQLGLIGGLPFGVITRVLEGQGAIPKTQPPYINPKTGELVPDKIPDSLRAKAQVALGDIIDTMFTFPGRQAGLGSKTDLRNTLTGNVLKPAPGEVTSVARTQDLTAEQKNKQRVLGATAATPAPAPTAVVPQKVSIGTPTITPIYKASNKAKRGKTLAKRPGTF